MATFGLSPLPPFPSQGEGFPTGIQFQSDGVNLGPPNPTFVNLSGLGQTGTFDPETGTVNYVISGGASGGGGGFTPKGFSASLTNDQTSGTRLLFDNTTTNGGIGYAGWDSSLGILTIQAGDGGQWMFGAEVTLEAGIEAVGLTREVDIHINSGTYGQSMQITMNAGDLQNLSAETGLLRVADGAQITVDVNSAFAAGTSGVRAVGQAATRFWAVRLGD